jgi:hypothetical protein
MAETLSCGCYRNNQGRRYLCTAHAAQHGGGVVVMNRNLVALVEALTYHVIRMRDNEDAHDELMVLLAKLKADTL